VTTVAKAPDHAGDGTGGFRQSRRTHNREFSRNSRRWLKAIGERNRLFLGEGYASRGAVGTLVAHPCWLFSVADTIVSKGHVDLHTAIAEVQWEFERWVRLGDRLTPLSRMVGERRVASRFAGESLLQTGETVFVASGGSVLARATTTSARFSRESAVERGTYLNDYAPYRYTQEDLFAIEDAYDNEVQRGADPRWVEDVVVGEAIGPLVRGPLTSEDMLEFVGSTRPAPAFGRFDDELQRHPGAGFLDESGLWESWTASLLDTSVARQIGYPAAHDAGIDRIAWIASMLTNWMGDDGFLSALTVRLVRPLHLMDTFWCRGEVTEVQGGPRPGVTCRLNGLNQRGEVVATGTARVELPSRRGAHPVIDGR
jgi:acyl dehydratase